MGLEAIKNALLRYLLRDVEGIFEQLTPKEREIVGNAETFRQLLRDLDLSLADGWRECYACRARTNPKHLVAPWAGAKPERDVCQECFDGAEKKEWHPGCEDSDPNSCSSWAT